MANSVDPDQTAPIGAVCSGSMLFASILKMPITTAADDKFCGIFSNFRKKIRYDIS